MYAKLRVAALILCLVHVYACAHKIIYLISPPRTLSTVLLRCIQARGDMIIFNEPSQYAYLSMLQGGGAPGGYEEGIAFKTYGEAKKAILCAGRDGMVFVKEPSCAAHASMYNDDAFLSDPQIEFCFIIRNPHDSIVSYYKALDLRYRALDEFGWKIERRIYEHQYALYKKITKLRKRAPLVISSEELAEAPEKVLPAFCEAVGIEFNSNMLSWPSLQGNFNRRDWHEAKTHEACLQWHKDAIASTHFRSFTRHFEIDYKGRPTFSEFDDKYKTILTEIYENYMNFYNKMYVHRLRC